MSLAVRPHASSLALALAVALLAVLGAVPARAQVRATVDASETHAPISPHVYGQFLEHAGEIINDILWAEMLDDRKFYYPVVGVEPAGATGVTGMRRPPLRRWVAIGDSARVTMDPHRSFVGEHTPRLALDGATPVGIRQGGLAVEDGEGVVGRIALKADGDAAVDVSLVWGDGRGDRQTVTVPILGADYVTYPLAFTAGDDATDARVEVTATGTGSVWVGTLSLMPADHLGGFRREVIAELAQLHSGSYRFPGGNFVSSHEWRNAIGDPDRRPPVFDPVWSAVQPNDVGTDEFLTLCALVGVEPYITVSAGFADAYSAAQYVEYTNGAANTTMGRLRAANGHPEPYDVKLWGIGNEAWGEWQMGAMKVDQFVHKHNEFADAMLAVDSSIVLIGSGAMPDAMTGSGESQRITGEVVPELLGPADWSGRLLLAIMDKMDLLSEHYYSYGATRYDVTRGEQVPVDPDEPLTDWMRRPANHVQMKVEAYRDYERLIPGLRENPVPIALDEWAFVGGPIRPNSYRAVPALSWALHEMFRYSDLFTLGSYTFGTSLVSANKTDAVLNPVGMFFKFYRDHYGTIPVTVAGDSPQPDPKSPLGGEEPRQYAGSPTFPLDVAAAWTDDRSALTVAVINPTLEPQTLDLSIDGAELAGTGTRWFMAPESLDATVAVGQDPEVEVESEPLSGVPSRVSVEPFSVSIYRLDAR